MFCEKKLEVFGQNNGVILEGDWISLWRAEKCADLSHTANDTRVVKFLQTVIKINISLFDIGR